MEDENKGFGMDSINDVTIGSGMAFPHGKHYPQEAEKEEMRRNYDNGPGWHGDRTVLLQTKSGTRKLKVRWFRLDYIDDNWSVAEYPMTPQEDKERFDCAMEQIKEEIDKQVDAGHLRYSDIRSINF